MYSKSLIVGVSALLASHGYAIEFLQPRATSVAADKLGVLGFSPAPTTSPQELKARALRLFQPRSQFTTKTCGYLEAMQNEPYTCGIGSACIWNTNSYYFGCCSANNDGDFYLSSCPGVVNPYTSCYPYSRATDCVGACYTQNRVCDSALPHCAAGYLTAGATIYTQYFCNSLSEGATLNLYTTYTVNTVPTSTISSINGNSAGTIISSVSSAAGGAPALNVISEGVGSNSVVTVTQTQTSVPASSSSSLSGSSSGSSGFQTDIKPKKNIGAIAGGVVGGLAAIATIAGGTILALHRRKVKQRQRAHMEVSQVSN